MRIVTLLAFISTILPVLATPESPPVSERPHILWITAEDMSPDLGSYGRPHAHTPVLDGLAREGVRYTRAFATAPVCSPARSCLITGLYANSLGTEGLRSVFPLPARVRGVPSYLRRAGYYTSNDVKTDYNCAGEPRLIRESWDACRPGADWRGRREGQPFFSVINLMTTHQTRTSVWPHEEFEAKIASRLSPEHRHDPARVPVPPFYPDTPEVRKDLARYHDCISVMDAQVGEILGKLEDDGLASNTIVFFYSDHGMGMPRGKRVLHDSGLHVPLIIRFPERFRHLAPAAPGETVDRLVSFVDFPPTLFELCGLEIPDHFQGKAFLGAGAGAPREYVFGARDRVDEVYDCSRSVRDTEFLYIRNYLPHLPWGQPERFSDNSPMRRRLLEMGVQGELEGAAAAYVRAPRPREELYRVSSDPHQVHDLAGDPDHREVLERMRRVNREHLTRIHDVGLIPEGDRWRIIGGGPRTSVRELVGDDERLEIEPVLEVLESPGDLAGLESLHPAVRYWTLVELRQRPDDGGHGIELVEKLRDLLTDRSGSVRIEAATALVERGKTEDGLEILIAELESPWLHDRLRAARALQLLGPRARSARGAMEQALEGARPLLDHHPLYLFLQFSLEDALEKLRESDA